MQIFQGSKMPPYSEQKKQQQKKGGSKTALLFACLSDRWFDFAFNSEDRVNTSFRNIRESLPDNTSDAIKIEDSFPVLMFGACAVAQV
jgi:hypothetical protein